MSSATVLETNLPIGTKRQGKVRDIYDLGDRLLLVATDRISAFDCVMPNGIPDKGRLLTGLSFFWFDFLKDVVENHLISGADSDLAAIAPNHAAMLSGRTMICKKAKVLPVECIVRGYLAGSGWKDYRTSQTVSGVALPSGLKIGRASCRGRV